MVKKIITLLAICFFSISCDSENNGYNVSVGEEIVRLTRYRCEKITKGYRNTVAICEDRSECNEICIKLQNR